MQDFKFRSGQAYFFQKRSQVCSNSYTIFWNFFSYTGGYKNRCCLSLSVFELFIVAVLTIVYDFSQIFYAMWYIFFLRNAIFRNKLFLFEMIIYSFWKPRNVLSSQMYFSILFLINFLLTFQSPQIEIL